MSIIQMNNGSEFDSQQRISYGWGIWLEMNISINWYISINLFYISSQQTRKQYNWIQAEQSHTHTAHTTKSWNEKEECTEEHQFTLTLSLKQQNTECM